MMEYFLFFVGIFLLIQGAKWLVDGSVILAKKLGVSSLVIGLTVVAFGTSLPELFVNIFAAIKGTTDISFGNIIGSNIANILLILGLSAMFSPIKVKRNTIWKEIPFSFLAALIFFVLAHKNIFDGTDGMMYRSDGLVFIGFFIIFLYYVFELAKREPLGQDKLVVAHKHLDLTVLFFIVGGLFALFYGGRWTVQGAVFFAKQVGLSEYIISSTIIAVGTSLPELVTSFIAVRKAESDLAVGNAVGSNIFNIFFIMGLTLIISPAKVPKVMFDFLTLGIATFSLFLFMFIGKKHQLKKWQGCLFVLLSGGKANSSKLCLRFSYLF
ncbi:calcium/sodium antiporter [Candidatus Woesearchaeota archaeon]|nr:calcium/sodium antiporter [Candidatus Woesearchaeota archaeon]